jgi:hypothetical protein
MSRKTKSRLWPLCLSAFVVSIGCGHFEADEQAHDFEAPTNQLIIKFTKPVLQLPDAWDTVGVSAFSDEALHLRAWFAELDEDMAITRFRPEFSASDTLQVSASGETIHLNNWSLVYRFVLTKPVDFKEVESALDQESLIEWVAPPIQVRVQGFE